MSVDISFGRFEQRTGRAHEAKPGQLEMLSQQTLRESFRGE